MNATNHGHVHKCGKCGELYLEQFPGLVGVWCPKCIRRDELEESEDEE